MRSSLALLPVLLAACAHSPDALSPLQGKAFEQVAATHPAVRSVERYEVRLPQRERLPYAGAFAAAFDGSLPYAPGSGLSYAGRSAEGELVFWGIGDRGPNADSPSVRKAGREQASKIFLVPAFVPRLAEIRVRPGEGARVLRTLPIHFGAEPASGLPIPVGQTGASGEQALDDHLQPLPFSLRGLDPEGIVRDRAGNFWIVDEYGPFLTQLDARGQVLRHYAPGKGLPEILAARQPNRGFEGVALSPSGKVYAAVQSTLDIDGKSKHQARFTRIVELDPVSGKTRQFAYPLDLKHYRRAGDAKIGDLVAIDDERFALIDQGAGKNGMRNLIQLIDIRDAEDISERRTQSGQALEFASEAELKGVRMVQVKALLDLRELGWQAEKAEGLALLEDGIAVINDNDFGLQTRLSGAQGDNVGAYRVENGKLTAGGQLSVEPNHEPTSLWLIRLRQPLQGLKGF
ncbi:esterase-like activity of phytase family protein [Uliginosibacterium sp. 31-12]|uniref:esterase-like activity of phytase family protein n=1 Tax=Uliginosibacterium sp. 31-12 TaxID=3062781 RepID=UPI0026E3561C|nr:esterase-like activity of phytase family protein [Uliginosibacterium sp. 31-12]MDO6387525.1 esterase-like activity of phytase family protein [Uliginosibacterium sp. 31-12]